MAMPDCLHLPKIWSELPGHLLYVTGPYLNRLHSQSFEQAVALGPETMAEAKLICPPLPTLTKSEIVAKFIKCF